MIDLHGKVAVVTGSSRGIGRAIAEGYSRAGARVVVSSRSFEACEPVATLLRQEGGDVTNIPCHIGRKEQLRALTDRTLEKYGRIDVLVCNAAINPIYGPSASVSDEAFDKIMGTNVRSTFWLCNMVIPGMASRRSGSVILISSIAGLRGSTTIGCYGVSKAAESALARNLALEWGPANIRVNSIAPGLIATDFAKALIEDPKRRAHVESRTPLRRIGRPEEIAGVALFLACDLSSFVTGQVIVADGGDMVA
jgi:dehydrogenase/reductase SDR family protein 4